MADAGDYNEHIVSIYSYKMQYDVGDNYTGRYQPYSTNAVYRKDKQGMR
jgi:hypothetical protein